MVENRDEPPPEPEKRRRRQPTPEEVWIRGFLEFSGTDNVTRYWRDDLRGVSLTRVIEAIFLGEMVRSKKCEGPGTVCTFLHDEEAGSVEVEVFFVAGEMRLEIREALTVEVQSEPNDAA